jgi:hypothetical protein
MANSFIKPTVVTAAGLGVLVRELTLPRLVWQNPVGSFAGALNDTISIRVPAYATARTRALRSGTTRTRDSLTERKIDVTLDTDVYKDVRITDEELTLDISDFGAQILNPVMAAIARKLEDAIATEITGATYPAQNTIAYDYSDDDPFTDLAVAARRKLNDAQVPMAGRVLLVGSGIEAELLSSDKLVKVNESGSSGALRDAQVGRIAGFEVVTSPAIDPDSAYAFHRSAFVMSTAAPIVPAGAPYGASSSFDGFAMRVVRVLDSATIEDILAVDAWVGTGVVTDEGAFDANGMWQPSEGAVGAAVTTVTGEADTELFTQVAHGLAVNDRIVFTALTGGAGLTVGQEYFVKTAPDADTFTVSETVGGATAAFTTDVTAGTYREQGSATLVRAVKVTAVA